MEIIKAMGAIIIAFGAATVLLVLGGLFVIGLTAFIDLFKRQ